MQGLNTGTEYMLPYYDPPNEVTRLERIRSSTEWDPEDTLTFARKAAPEDGLGFTCGPLPSSDGPINYTPAGITLPIPLCSWVQPLSIKAFGSGSNPTPRRTFTTSGSTIIASTIVGSYLGALAIPYLEHGGYGLSVPAVVALVWILWAAIYWALERRTNSRSSSRKK